ncbi:ATPase inhibitor subunit zeta [Microvirga sp. VF16]|uniref:ATPase inhibitor subunit zeta n=1 Tax=Microvirga sp. VF16 TaxID=2807101 RepID=UPI00193CBCEF|nr:ATPase inhibitor subunit zeta [Microvirga sp. VF16]QRM32997.1 DUF1476 family protein [Microvirga sp. VF16]
MMKPHASDSLDAGSGHIEDWDGSDSPVRRRNVLACLWVGGKIGLEGAALSRYVQTILDTSEQSGDNERLVSRLVADLTSFGVGRAEAIVSERVSYFHQEALRQLAVTD